MRIIPPPVPTDNNIEEELASKVSDSTWQMFERIFDRDGMGEALKWWKETMEEGGYVL